MAPKGITRKSLLSSTEQASSHIGRSAHSNQSTKPKIDLLTVLVLLSGGASALLEQLPAGVTLADLQRVNDWLLGSGLDIHAMNAVRKRLSRVKGGRLAQALFPRCVHGLAISDVPGDDPRAIGSGPLSADPRPVEVQDLPGFIRDLLAHAAPLPGAGDACFQRVQVEESRSAASCRLPPAVAANCF